MISLLWLLLGLILGFVIGVLTISRDGNLLSDAQKRLKKGESITFSMSCYGCDDDDGDSGEHPLFPRTEQFKSN